MLLADVIEVPVTIRISCSATTTFAKAQKEDVFHIRTSKVRSPSVNRIILATHEPATSVSQDQRFELDEVNNLLRSKPKWCQLGCDKVPHIAVVRAQLRKNIV